MAWWLAVEIAFGFVILVILAVAQPGMVTRSQAQRRQIEGKRERAIRAARAASDRYYASHAFADRWRRRLVLGYAIGFALVLFGTGASNTDPAHALTVSGLAVQVWCLVIFVWTELDKRRTVALIVRSIMTGRDDEEDLSDRPAG